MKKIILIACLFPFALKAQFGLKAGLNFTNVTSFSSVNNQSSSGFNLGIFYATPYNRIIGSKTELVFSRQGYSYETNAVSGNVNLDYIMLPTYLCINITKFFQIQVGMQFGYLMSANADSASKTGNTPAGALNSAMNYYNRFTYSIGGGVEVHPFKGSLVGARMNVGLNNLYKIPDGTVSEMPPSYVPDINIKANLFQIYVGWRFGK